MEDKLIFRPLKEEDYETICKWWKWWRWTVLPKDFLPNNGEGGFMIEKNNVPIVATIEGIPILVTSTPFTNPANIPSEVANINAIKKLPSVDVIIIPNMRDVIPTIDGNDKSISPSIITIVIPKAMMPKTITVRIIF